MAELGYGGSRWGGRTKDKSKSMDGGLKGKSKSMDGGLKAGYDFGMLGAIGSAITGLMDGTLSFSDQTSDLQRAQRATTADRSGGPGNRGITQTPQTVQNPLIPTRAPSSPEALQIGRAHV